MKNLDAEEQEILDAFEAGALKRPTNAKAEIKRHQEYAANCAPSAHQPRHTAATPSPIRCW